MTSSTRVAVEVGPARNRSHVLSTATFADSPMFFGYEALARVELMESFRLMNLGLQLIILARRENQTVGIIEGLYRPTIHHTPPMVEQLFGDSTVCLENLHVKKQLRGRGIGTALITAAEAAAEADGRTEARLAVYGSNDNAIRLYDRLGYRPQSSIRHHETRTLVVMRKAL